MLSSVSSVFDPLGIAGPFILQGKKILQRIIGLRHDWDDPVPKEYELLWNRWKAQVMKLDKLNIARCYKGNCFQIKDISLHIYSDASSIGYGTVAYFDRRILLETLTCHL